MTFRLTPPEYMYWFAPSIRLPLASSVVNVPVLATTLPICVFCIPPPAYNAPPIPTPPTTVNAPVAVFVAVVELLILIAEVVVEPLLVTVCNVLVFEIVTAPVLVLIEVSVPATILPTPYVPTVAAVNI